jgi:hypothetical protein
MKSCTYAVLVCIFTALILKKLNITENIQDTTIMCRESEQPVSDKDKIKDFKDGSSGPKSTDRKEMQDLGLTDLSSSDNDNSKDRAALLPKS